MKKILISLLLLISVSFVSAQNNDQRTTATKVTDILARFPFQTTTQKNEFNRSIAQLDNAGFAELVNRLKAPGSTDNTAVEYALNAFSVYAMEKGNEASRTVAIEAYCNALSNSSLGFSRDYIIRQLELIGDDRAIACLSSLLDDEVLGGPSARALAAFNSPAANAALLTALNGSNTKNEQSLIEALGYNRYKPAAPVLEKKLKNADQDSKKVLLNAISSIGSLSSYKPLLAEARASGFNFDNSGATGAYINYLQQLHAQGETKRAARYVAEFIRLAEGSGQVHSRIAGLRLFTQINEHRSLPVLMRAMQDNDPEYRAAALEFAVPFSSSLANRQWINTLNAAPDAAKVQVLDHLAETGDLSDLPELQQYLAHENSAIRVAAVRAVGRIGKGAGVPALLELMKSGNEADVKAVKSSLLLLSGSDVTAPVLKAYPSMPANAKVALLDVLAARASSSASALIIAEAGATDTAISSAAIRALPAVVAEKNSNELFTLLGRADNSGKQYIQQAIARSVADMDTAAQTMIVARQMRNVEPAKRSDYFPILSAIGGRDAFNALEANYNSGNDQTKKAAIAALSSASGKQPADILLRILRDSANQSHRKEVVDALINVTSKSSFAPNQNVLVLREAMNAAVTAEQQRRILRETARNKTFPALLLAGEHLDNAQLKAASASAVMNIALADKNINGPVVRDMLTRAMNSLTGADSEYQKQAVRKHLDELPSTGGFVALFNGKDLTGWKGLVENPVKRAKMSAAELEAAQKKADAEMRKSWIVENGLLVFTGKGENLVTEKMYGDFELFVDWKITKDGDAGIYLRGTPQVQIWDTARVDVGAQVGSGGLYNNQKNPSKPLVMADNAIGEWNNFHIIMKGDKVTVYLNGQLVTDNVTLENYWDRNQPIFPKEQIELQAHGTYVAYRNIYVRELNADNTFSLSAEEKAEGYEVLFDGTNLDQWQGNKSSYRVDNGTIHVKPGSGSGGNLYSNKEYGNFTIRFEFQLTPGANNGLGIRAPLTGDAAYEGMEIQILDNDAPVYKNLEIYQYHGSVYGIIPAKRGFLKPTGEWNTEEVTINGSDIKVVLNGTTILEGNLDEATKNGTLDKRAHPGLKRKKGHIAFLGHGSELRIRNVRVKEL